MYVHFLATVWRSEDKFHGPVLSGFWGKNLCHEAWAQESLPAEECTNPRNQEMSLVTLSLHIMSPPPALNSISLCLK